MVELYASVKVGGLDNRRFTHSTYWEAVSPYLNGQVKVKVEGQSAEGREILRLTFGSGSVTVLLWSQMHGDESTASMALADIIRFFHEHSDHPVARRIAGNVSIHMVHMLNPDGAVRFQRRYEWSISSVLSRLLTP